MIAIEIPGEFCPSNPRSCSLRIGALAFAALLLGQCAPGVFAEPAQSNPDSDCEEVPRRTVQEGVRVHGRYRASIQKPGALICHAKSDECETVRLTPPPEYPGDSAVVNLYVLVDDRRSVLATVRLTESDGSQDVEIKSYALPSGVLQQKFKIQGLFVAASLFALLDDHLYVRDCVGAGPGCGATIYPLGPGISQPFKVKPVQRVRPQSKPAGEAGAEALNMYEGSEIRLGPGRWVFVSATGERIVWMDFAKRRATRSVSLVDRRPGIEAPQTAFPWLAENADPSSGNFAYRVGEALHIVYARFEKPPADGKYWRMRLNLKDGAMHAPDRVKLCPSS